MTTHTCRSPSMMPSFLTGSHYGFPCAKSLPWDLLEQTPFATTTTASCCLNQVTDISPATLGNSGGVSCPCLVLCIVFPTKEALVFVCKNLSL